jgi:hypothetical protein
MYHVHVSAYLMKCVPTYHPCIIWLPCGNSEPLRQWCNTTLFMCATCHMIYFAFLLIDRCHEQVRRYCIDLHVFHDSCPIPCDHVRWHAYIRTYSFHRRSALRGYLLSQIPYHGYPLSRIFQSRVIKYIRIYFSGFHKWSPHSYTITFYVQSIQIP